MTAININFLSDRRLEVQRAQSLDKQIFRATVGVFTVVLAIVLGGTAYWRYEMYQLSTIKESQQEQARIVTSAADDEALYLLYTTRLDLIGSVFEVRSSKRRAMEFLAQLVQPSVTFDSVTYDSASRVLQYRVAAENVFAVELYLERLRSPDVRSQVAELAVGSIRRDQFGGYTLENSVVLTPDDGEASAESLQPAPAESVVSPAAPTLAPTTAPSNNSPSAFDALPSADTITPEESEPESTDAAPIDSEGEQL